MSLVAAVLLGSMAIIRGGGCNGSHWTDIHLQKASACFPISLTGRGLFKEGHKGPVAVLSNPQQDHQDKGAMHSSSCGVEPMASPFPSFPVSSALHQHREKKKEGGGMEGGEERFIWRGGSSGKAWGHFPLVTPFKVAHAESFILWHFHPFLGEPLQNPSVTVGQRRGN